MSTQFKMPQLGETVTEGTITRWLKREGETVEADEPLVEVSTDKVDSEIPSPVGGTVERINFQEGETVMVGQVIAEIGDGDLKVEAPMASEPQEVERTEVAKVAPDAGESRRGILSPLVRKLAAEHQVDLNTLKGTGTGGRITKQDILSAVGQTASAAVSEPAATEGLVGAKGGDEVINVTPMRKAIAVNMVASLRETARAWNAVEIDMSNVARLREQAADEFKKREGFSLTWMPFLSKATSQALQKFPQVNSTWNGDGTITRKHHVNLGIAVALENGLIVPVIKGADAMSLVGLARGVRDVATRARTKKLTPDDVAGGTFTITNPGPFGSILSVPIINTGQAAILAFDAVVKRPVVVTDEHGDDAIAVRQMVFISMSWDHRVIDGAEAAQFLAHLKELLQGADFASDLNGYLPADL